jgi:hypothetical protein
MDFKKLIGKATDLAKEHSDKLGPLSRRMGGFVGKEQDPKQPRTKEPRRARRTTGADRATKGARKAH